METELSSKNPVGTFIKIAPIVLSDKLDVVALEYFLIIIKRLLFKDVQEFT